MTYYRSKNNQNLNWEKFHLKRKLNEVPKDEELVIMRLSVIIEVRF